MCDLSKIIKANMLSFSGALGSWAAHYRKQCMSGMCTSSSPVVLHGNNLLVFGGTGIPFGESNGNDVHVCNVKYKRWALLSCRGKRPSRIYGQVLCTAASGPCACLLCASSSARIQRCCGFSATELDGAFHFLGLKNNLWLLHSCVLSPFFAVCWVCSPCAG